MKNFSSLLSLAWENFKSNWPRFIGLALITFLFEFVLGLILYLVIIPQVGGNFNWQDLDLVLPAFINVLPQVIVILVLLALITYWLHLALYFAASSKEMALGKALMLAGRKYLAAIGLLIIYVLIMSAGFVFFIIPAIILGIYLVPVFPVLLFENKNPFSAISRSFSLVKGKWWPVFGRVALFALFLGGIYLILAISHLQYIAHLIEFVFWPIFLYCLYQELLSGEGLKA